MAKKDWGWRRLLNQKDGPNDSVIVKKRAKSLQWLPKKLGLDI